MRKLYFFIMAVLMSMPLLAQEQEEREDENPGGWNFTLPINLVRHESPAARFGYFNQLSSYFSLGFIGSVKAEAPVDLNVGESFELEWGNISSARARLSKSSYVRLGWGIAWRNHRMTNNLRFCKENDGSVSLSEFPEGSTPKYSRIKTFGITAPLKYYQRLGRGMFIALGPEFEYIISASIKTRYTQDGVKQKDVEKGFRYNHFSVGLGAEIAIQDISIYYKYTPTPVLQSTNGPKFGSQTLGIRLHI